jgi:hypothetical protein
MTDRWKYQIKTGGLWGLTTATILSLFNLIDKSLKKNLYLKIYRQTTFILLCLGFFIGLLSVGRKAERRK